MNKNNILYETAKGNFYITTNGKFYEVWKNTATHAVRIAQVGNGPNHGLNYAIQIAEEREGETEE